MQRYVKLSGIVLMFLLFLSSPGFSQTQTEQLVITTYYPSPFGSYRQLGVTDTDITADRKAFTVSQSGAVGGTGYAIYATKTGASTTNVGGYFSASGGTNNYGIQIPVATAAGANNYAIYSDSPAKSYFAGSAGIGGLPRPADQLAVYGRVSTNFAGAGTQQMFSFDLAEDIPATTDVGAADVVVIDSTTNVRVTKSTKPYDTLVAGVISTSPAFHIAMPDGKTPLALAGRVLCKVTTQGGGPIKIGDLLVTSSKAGYAMKGDSNKIKVGTVLGKAMEPLEKGEGKITVLVTLQ